MSHYVRVIHALSRREPVPFTRLAPWTPGRYEAWRNYGPYTERGAAIVARRIFRAEGWPEAPGQYPSGTLWAADEDGATVVMVRTHTDTQPIRNYPREASA
jgi:hypothetical protein